MTTNLPDFDAIASRQSWSADGVALVALGFISTRLLGPALVRYAERVAAAENGDTSQVLPDDPGCFAHLDPTRRQVVRSALRKYAAAGGLAALERVARELLALDGAQVEDAPGHAFPDRPFIAELTTAVPGVGARGDLAVVVSAAEEGRAARMLVTEQGFAPAHPVMCVPHAGWSPYDTFDEAQEARAAGTFSTRPVKAEQIIHELVDQLDAIGIPDWAGAEGLCLEAARAYLSGPGPSALQAERAERAERSRIGWNAEDYPYEDWQAEVANGDTTRSYGDWVIHQREMALINEQHDAEARAAELLGEVFIVNGECSDVEDGDVEGRYRVTFDPPVPRALAATLALDEFHETVAVGVLDDFEFSVEDMDGEALHESDDTAGAKALAVHVVVARID